LTSTSVEFYIAACQPRGNVGESECRRCGVGAWKRLGFEGGGGIGKVFSEFSEFTDEPWLPGAWGSATYKIMEKQDIRARMTLAYGKSGVLFYFGVGQNF
jgi:hypothetical protein